MNYYEHHLGDYYRKAKHLTLLEHGAYRMLLDLYQDPIASAQEVMSYLEDLAFGEDV